jgi:O-antigen/teichoic acid export membrane protein
VAVLRTWIKRATGPTVLVMVLMGVAARPLIPLISHGRYPSSIPVFQILLFGVVAYYLTLPAGNLLMAQGRYRALAIAYGAAFVINAIGDFIIGPTTGVIGISVVATVVLVGVSGVVARLALRRVPVVGASGPAGVRVQPVPSTLTRGSVEPRR